uniref:Uncharacterized protein n=1 Tax=Arundo donax TaxID=35708 RepID=A0A0A8Z5E5_ARUDO
MGHGWATKLLELGQSDVLFHVEVGDLMEHPLQKCRSIPAKD